jgi:hypothetical protein
MLLTMLFFLSISFRLNSTNRRDLQSLLSLTDSITFHSRADCLFCKPYADSWLRLESHFFDSPEIALVTVASSSAPDVPSFVQQHAATGRQHRVSFGADFETMRDYLQSLIDLKRRFACQQFNDTFPAFVFTFRDSAACSVLASALFFVPDQAAHVFWQPGPTMQLEFGANATRRVKFSGASKPTAYADFIREFSLENFGDWDYFQLPPLRRRFCFFIYVNSSQLDQFPRMLGEYEDSGVFGKMAMAEFRVRYTKIAMDDRDSPALAVMNANGRFTLIRRASAGSRYFRHLLAGAMAGRMDMSMRHLVKGAPRGQPMDVDGKRFVFCGVLAALSVAITVGVIWRRAWMCVNHHGRRPAVLSLA